MNRRKATILLGLILCMSCLILYGCSREKNAVKEAVYQELGRLKSSDTQTIENCIDTQDMLPPSQDHQDIGSQMAEIYTLFYKDFSYKVKKVQIQDETHAKAKTQLHLMDTHSLAKDYSLAVLKKHIQQQADPTGSEFSLQDSCELLKDLIKNNDHPLKEKTVLLSLEKEKEEWQVVHSAELDDQLTGDLSLYLTDPWLLSPSEIVSAHLDTIRDFDRQQLIVYLSLDELEDDGDYSAALASALADQIQEYFDYEILEENTEGSQAIVKVRTTTVDFESILSSYKEQLSTWLEENTSQSLSGGAQGRREKEQEILLSCVRNNKKTASKEVSLELQNDGTNWKIQMDASLSGAVLGDITTALDPAA